MSASVKIIVAGVQTPGEDEPQLAAALALAERAGAELHLVHAFEVSPEALETYARAGYREVEPIRLYCDGLQARLEGAVRRVSQRGHVTCHAVHGPPARALSRVAEVVGADVIAVGDAHPSALASALLGTTAGRLFRAARTPVLVMRGPARPPRRVLAAVDLSEPSARALELGVAAVGTLTEDGAPEVRALFAAGTELDPFFPRDEGRAARMGLDLLREFVAGRSLPAGVEPRVRVGEAAHEIVDEAAEWEADLVVLGTHGRGGVRRMLLGSVAEAVVRSAPCPVLVVPAPLLGEAREEEEARAAGVGGMTLAML